MLTIIHGDNISESRKYFLEQNEKYPTVQILDGEKVTLTDLAQIFDGGELFSESKVAFIEYFLTKRKKSKEKDALVTLLHEYATNHQIFLWEGRELERSVLNQCKTATIKIFKLPQTLFLLLDTLKPNNGKQLISLFHQTISTTEVEMIFFMLVRQVRLLLVLSNPRHPGQARMTENIDELKRLAPWQVTKLQQQARLFSPQQLITFYDKLFQLEKGQKTGNLSSSLISSIDFLLLEL